MESELRARAERWVECAHVDMFSAVRSAEIRKYLLALLQREDKTPSVRPSLWSELGALREDLLDLVCDEDLTDEKLQEAAEGPIPLMCDALGELLGYPTQQAGVTDDTRTSDPVRGAEGRTGASEVMARAEEIAVEVVHYISHEEMGCAISEPCIKKVFEIIYEILQREEPPRFHTGEQVFRHYGVTDDAKVEPVGYTFRATIARLREGLPAMTPIEPEASSLMTEPLYTSPPPEGMADGCLDMIRETLEAMGTDMSQTPPMMYPEAIRATVTRLVGEGGRDSKAMEKLRSMSTEEWPGWTFCQDGCVLTQDGPLSISYVHKDPADAILAGDESDE